MNDFERETGARVRALRETAGYSREQLSEMADISVKFLYEIESGKKRHVRADALPPHPRTRRQCRQYPARRRHSSGA